MLTGAYYFGFLGSNYPGYQTTGMLLWAPTLTSHDPNPPITLEDEEEPGGVAAKIFDGPIYNSVIFNSSIVR